LVSEALEGEHFALKPVARRCGELLTNITGTTAQASADARAWEVLCVCVGEREGKREVLAVRVGCVGSV
jgi:hypothetical protein